MEEKESSRVPGLAELVEPLTTEREVAGPNPREARPVLWEINLLSLAYNGETFAWFR